MKEDPRPTTRVTPTNTKGPALSPNPDSLFNNFNKSQFKSLLNLVTKSSTFLFNEKLYKQIDGVAMGTPCGPTLANIFCVFMKRTGSIIAHLSLNLSYTRDM